ncbi:MAG: nitroreductase [Thermodesulfobacteriota bacterium]
MDVRQAMENRSSKRAFLDRPVSGETILDLLSAAGRAPSAINLQPWEFTVVSGEERLRLSRNLVKAYRERNIGCSSGASSPLPERFKARQYDSFTGLEQLMSLGRQGIMDFVNEGSLNFYGAPAAIIITKDQAFPEHYLTSTGIMIGYLLLAAEAKGLATCPIGLIRNYEEIVLDFLNLEERNLVLGVALGYADPDAPVNRLRTPREPVEALVRWYG